MCDIALSVVSFSFFSGSFRMGGESMLGMGHQEEIGFDCSSSAVPMDDKLVPLITIMTIIVSL